VSVTKTEKEPEPESDDGTTPAPVIDDGLTQRTRNQPNRRYMQNVEDSDEEEDKQMRLLEQRDDSALFDDEDEPVRPVAFKKRKRKGMQSGGSKRKAVTKLES